MTPIRVIQENTAEFLGQEVTIEGIVTLGAGIVVTTRTDAYLQDGSGRGINIFSFDLPTDPPNTLLERGNRLRITGTVDEFGDITEIVDYTIEFISSGNPIPDPLPLSTAGANDISLEGTYIGVVGVIEDLAIFSDAASITLNDGSGDLAIRVWGTTGINVTSFNVGDSLAVTAVMDLFNSTSQLTPGYQDELAIPGLTPGDGSGTARISPQTVNELEEVSETITITASPEYVLESVSVSIPENWIASNLAGNIALSGPGFANAVASVQGREVIVRNAVLTDLDEGSIEISRLTAPGVGRFSTFVVKTAVAGGRRFSIAASPVVQVGSGQPNGEVVPIALIQENTPAFEGLDVTIEGVITLGAGIIIADRTDAYIQDESGKGINIFRFDAPDPSERIDRFNRLRVSGTIVEFGGVTEITDYSVQFLSSNNPLPPPLSVSSNIANDPSFEGTYMRVQGIVDDIEPDDNGNIEFIVRDERGATTIRVWGNTGINTSFVVTGDTVIIQGVMDSFSNATQLIPGYRDEIVVPGKNARADGSGIATISSTAAEADTSIAGLSISILGSIDDPVTVARIDVPVLWQWSGDENNVSLSGSAAENGVVNVIVEEIDSVYQVFLTDVNITQEDTAVVTFNGLRTPPNALNSIFWVRTAGNGGRLALMPDPPRMEIAGGGRDLIYDIQTNSNEFRREVNLQAVTTVGVGLIRVTVSSGDSVTSAYIQDESGRGVNIFRFDFDRNIQRGNLVALNGVPTEFGGITEIEYTESSILQTGVDLPQAVKLTNADVNSLRWDGTLVETEGVILEKFSAGGGTTLEIGDGAGTTNSRIWDTARLDLSGFNENDRIFAEGVGGLFVDDGDSIFQMLTTYQDQISLDPDYAPTLSSVSLQVEAHPFVPDRGEEIDITYSAAAVNNRVTIRIFDLGGRLISTLLDENANVVQNTFAWNGRDRLNELVPLGTYVCHLEVLEPVTGDRKVEVAPIVVGTMLTR